MDNGKTMIVGIAAAGLMVFMCGSASAQDDQGVSVTSAQVQGGAGRMQTRSQEGRGYPGHRRPDDMQQGSRRKPNKISQIVEDERRQMKALSADRSLTKEQKMEKARQIREAAETRIKAVLPPEEWKRHEDAQQKARQVRDALRSKNTEESSEE